MTVKLLNESSTTLREHSGNRWKATLITPGKGSSGTYGESMLAEHASTAFPAGTKLFFNHPAKGSHAGQRDARDQWGFLPEAATYEPGVGIVGEPEVLPHAKDIVDSLGTQAALSVWVMGESDEQGNVTALHPDVTNSVDIVAYPGREGSGLTEKMYEAFIAASEEPRVTSALDKTKESKMDEKILEALSALSVSVGALVTAENAKAEAAAKAEADKASGPDAVEEAVKAYGVKVKAINDAKDLLPSQTESLLSAAERGEDIAPLLEQATKVVAEAKAVLSEGISAGRAVTLGTSTGFAIEGLDA